MLHELRAAVSSSSLSSLPRVAFAAVIATMRQRPPSTVGQIRQANKVRRGFFVSRFFMAVLWFYIISFYTPFIYFSTSSFLFFHHSSSVPAFIWFNGLNNIPFRPPFDQKSTNPLEYELSTHTYRSHSSALYRLSHSFWIAHSL